MTHRTRTGSRCRIVDAAHRCDFFQHVAVQAVHFVGVDDGFVALTLGYGGDVAIHNMGDGLGGESRGGKNGVKRARFQVNSGLNLRLFRFRN